MSRVKVTHVGGDREGTGRMERIRGGKLVVLLPRLQLTD